MENEQVKEELKTAMKTIENLEQYIQQLQRKVRRLKWENEKLTKQLTKNQKYECLKCDDPFAAKD